MSTQPQITPKTSVAKVEIRNLILINDDINTFQHVIDCLMSICDHSELQAEQCAYIVHYKGECAVKSGTIQKLEPLLVALQLQNLSAKIR
jgi:ATP-dependent Clp protease adaptor protein ClpS